MVRFWNRRAVLQNSEHQSGSEHQNGRPQEEEPQEPQEPQKKNCSVVQEASRRTPKEEPLFVSKRRRQAKTQSNN